MHFPIGTLPLREGDPCHQIILHFRVSQGVLDGPTTVAQALIWKLVAADQMAIGEHVCAGIKLEA